MITGKKPSENPYLRFKKNPALIKLKDSFDNNEALNNDEINILLEIPKDITDQKELSPIYSYLNLMPSTIETDLYNSYCLALGHRYDLVNKDLSAVANHPLNLNRGEELYYSDFSSIHERRIKSSNIAYSGLRWNSGLLRAGSLSYIKNDSKDFVMTDYGTLYITNRRLIFVGDRNFKTVSMPLNNILSYYVYRDGVIILASSRNSILFKFGEVPIDELLKELDPVLSDGIFKFITILAKVQALC